MDRDAHRPVAGPMTVTRGADSARPRRRGSHRDVSALWQRSCGRGGDLGGGDAAYIRPTSPGDPYEGQERAVRPAILVVPPKAMMGEATPHCSPSNTTSTPTGAGAVGALGASCRTRGAWGALVRLVRSKDQQVGRPKETSRAMRAATGSPFRDHRRQPFVWRQDLTGTADASGLMQRSAGREPEHCSRPAGR